jgi:hypothetical protein
VCEVLTIHPITRAGDAFTLLTRSVRLDEALFDIESRFTPMYRFKTIENVVPPPLPSNDDSMQKSPTNPFQRPATPFNFTTYYWGLGV